MCIYVNGERTATVRESTEATWQTAVTIPEGFPVTAVARRSIAADDGRRRKRRSTDTETTVCGGAGDE